MEKGLFIQPGVIIPEQEIEMVTSRSSGAGGQHVNKTDSRITLRWNVQESVALTSEQKERLLAKLQSRLTSTGELVVHSSESRSQQQNKEAAFKLLAALIRQGLYVPKKRIATRVSQAVKAARADAKKRRSGIKKLRSKKNYDD